MALALAAARTAEDASCSLTSVPAFGSAVGMTALAFYFSTPHEEQGSKDNNCSHAIIYCASSLFESYSFQELHIHFTPHIFVQNHAGMQMTWKRPVKDVFSEIVCDVIDEISRSGIVRVQDAICGFGGANILPRPRKVLFFLGILFFEFVEKRLQIFHRVLLEHERCMRAKPSL